jgi:hypothetical protein
LDDTELENCYHISWIKRDKNTKYPPSTFMKVKTGMKVLHMGIMLKIRDMYELPNLQSKGGEETLSR